MAFSTQANRTSSIENGTKLYISNFDYGFSNEDIKVIEISTCFFYFSVDSFFQDLIYFILSEIFNIRGVVAQLAST